jgi:hypothetical protein
MWNVPGQSGRHQTTEVAMHPLLTEYVAADIRKERIAKAALARRAREARRARRGADIEAGVPGGTGQPCQDMMVRAA